MITYLEFEKKQFKKGAWSLEEDQKLIAYINRYGIWNWNEMPKAAGLQRTGKSCRLRWMNYLRPDIKHGNFTKEEDETIISLHQKLGNRWSAIAARLPGRTDNEIKNHWHSHLKKQLNNNNNNNKSDELKSENQSYSNSENTDGIMTNSSSSEFSSSSDIFSDLENYCNLNTDEYHFSPELQFLQEKNDDHQELSVDDYIMEDHEDSNLSQLNSMEFFYNMDNNWEINPQQQMSNEGSFYGSSSSSHSELFDYHQSLEEEIKFSADDYYMEDYYYYGLS